MLELVWSRHAVKKAYTGYTSCFMAAAAARHVVPSIASKVILNPRLSRRRRRRRIQFQIAVRLAWTRTFLSLTQTRISFMIMCPVTVSTSPPSPPPSRAPDVYYLFKIHSIRSWIDIQGWFFPPPPPPPSRALMSQKIATFLCSRWTAGRL